METKLVRWYHVVEFLTMPNKLINQYVCVPDMWIVSCIAKNHNVIIAYPEENADLTEIRVQKYQNRVDEWKTYRALVKYTTDSYDDAIGYIKCPKSYADIEVKQPAIKSLDHEYLLESQRTSHMPEYRASTSRIPSVGITNRNEDRVRLRPLKRSLNRDSDYLKQCKAKTAASSESVASQQMRPDPVIPIDDNEVLCLQVDSIEVPHKVSRIKTLATSVRNFERPCHSKQPLSSKTRTEQVVSIEFCELFTRMKAEFEEDALQINHLRIKHIERTGMFNEIVNAINKHVDLKYTIPTVTIPSELTSAIPLTDQVKEKEKDEIESNEEEKEDEEEDKAAKIKSDAGHKFTLPPEYDQKNSRWTLRYHGPAKGLVELMPLSGIYVNSLNLDNCQRLSKDCKSLARMLMQEIFSDNALKVCSLTGARSKAFDGTKVRPGLDEHARRVLLTYVEAYGKKQGWCTADKQALTISLRNKLQEIRGK